MPTLASILRNAAMGCEIAGNVALLELKNAPPEDALKFLTPAAAGGGGLARNNSELQKSFKNFMRYFVTLSDKGKSPLTGSCGQTSLWLDRIVTEGGAGQDMVEAPTATILSTLAAVTQARWYCRLSCGSHSFLIEHVDGQYCVYQSFHGSQSIQLSVNNILSNRHVFNDKASFFGLLGGALLDAQAYNTMRIEAAYDKAETAARMRGMQIPRNRLKALYEALNNYPAALNEWHDATPGEKEVVNKLNKEMDEIVDEVLASGTKQEKVFHGAIWTTADPSQYHLNTDPATPDEIATNIMLGLRPNRQKWTNCFEDTRSPMKARLKTLGIVV